MNQKFQDLSEEKKDTIINAGLEVLSQHPYAHASCDEIASKAGISKGLLFHYFHDKKEFYLYLLDYVYKKMVKEVVDEHFKEITDFFELLEYAANKKVDVLIKHPYITDFVIRLYLSENERISPDLHEAVNEMTDKMINDYFRNIDMEKFRDDIELKQIMNMMIWMGEGYLRDMRKRHKSFNMEMLLEEFKTWIVMFKRMAYKEEYI